MNNKKSLSSPQMRLSFEEEQKVRREDDITVRCMQSTSDLPSRAGILKRACAPNFAATSAEPIGNLKRILNSCWKVVQSIAGEIGKFKRTRRVRAMGFVARLVGLQKTRLAGRWMYITKYRTGFSTLQKRPIN